MSGRIVLVTGANSGVGFAITQVLVSASEDFHVIMTGRTLEKVNSALKEIETMTGAKGKMSSLQLDVVDEKSIEKAAALVDQKFGRLDVLVNNAGVSSASPDIRTRFNTCMETNVLGPALVGAAFRPLLLKSSNAYSIYVSSEVGSLTTAAGPRTLAARFPNGEMYRASKSALNMVMLDEWAKFKDQGIKTFGFCPGLVVSNLRGTSEEARTGRGMATNPVESARNVLSVLKGERDTDVGKVISKDTYHQW